MNKFSNMTYKEFRDYCSERVCDGQWSMQEAISCIQIIEKIDSIKVKGFFKKRATQEAKELEWRRLRCMI